MLDLARELSGDGPTEDLRRDPDAAPAPSPTEFWKKRFLNWSTPAPLPVTIAPANPAERVHTATHTIDSRELAAIKQAADEYGIPLPVLMTGAFALIFHRYAALDDITMGLVKSCVERDNAEVVPHVVPFRVMFHGDARVRPWLRSLAEQAREAGPFEFISLAQIRSAAGIPSETPLFNFVLSVGNNDFDPASLVTAGAVGPGRYELAAAVYLGSEVSLRIAYSAKTFSQQAIEQMLGHWAQLIRGLSRGSDEPLSALPLIAETERQQVLQGFNATDATYPDSWCVQQLFEAQVGRTPNAIALQFDRRKLSYAEVNHRANTLAHFLRSRGVGADSVVGICMPRSIEMAIAAIAVLKAGAAYLPLDPAYPHDRLQFMLDDARAKVLLTHNSLAAIFPNPPEHVVHLDEAWFQAATANPENLDSITNPENLAYLIYTSGSTGKPKGVAMVHRALVNLIDWQVRTSVAGPADKTLQFTSLSFDVSFQEIFSTWASGGTLVLITAEMRLSPRDLWQFIVRENIARIFLPFVALQQLADAAAAEQTLAPGLREVVTAGEQLQVTPRLRELFTRHPSATLHNHYGPSETHVVTALKLEGAPTDWPALPSIGRPIQNSRIYLLDKHMAPAPIGVPAELYIGGECLARGYFERPDITEARFVRDPFGKKDGARLYRTGDLARYLPNGEIEFLGRIDHQVKIRGYRVELGEIEAALNRQTGVRECVVVARDQDGVKQLVAYVIPHRGVVLNAQALRATLKQQLPEYMVPAIIVFLEKLPLTPSGKVDRRSLPSPEEVQPQAEAAPAQAAGETPWLPIQLQLVEIWQDLLKVKPIGIRDNFFELGGHSLLAVKMMDRVEQLTGKKVPVTELFNNATIAHLADLILQTREHSASPVITLQENGTKPPIYFLHGDIIGGGFYARDIARLLGDDQPFYVLPPSGMDGMIATVEEMTALHLRDLRAHQPRGPYVLAGFCVGALIAYHMAVRLKAEGEEVPWVALIDPQLGSKLLQMHYSFVRKTGSRKNYSDEKKLWMFAQGHKVLFRLRQLWQAPFSEKAGFAVTKARRILASRRNGHSVPAEAAVNGSGEANGSAEVLFKDGEQRILAAFNWILSAYRPPRYDGPVSMFMTDEQYDMTPFLEKRWSKVVSQLAVEHVPGSHLGAITTDVEKLASKMAEHFNRVVGSKTEASEALQPK